MHHHKQMQLNHTDDSMHMVKEQLNINIELEYKLLNISSEYNEVNIDVLVDIVSKILNNIVQLTHTLLKIVMLFPGCNPNRSKIDKFYVFQHFLELNNKLLLVIQLELRENHKLILIKLRDD